MRPVARPVVLVDFDGVVLRGQHAGKFIQNRVNNYLIDRVKIPKEHVCELNAELYNGWGHTWYGLKSMGWKEGLRDFNAHVYKGIKDHKEEIMMSDTEKETWNTFIKNIRDIDADVQMLSNAPLEWMTTCMDMDKDTELFDLHRDIARMECDRYLKPNRDVYDYIMSVYKRRQIYFVDDKLKNFEYVVDNPKWINMWMTEKKMKHHIRKNIWNVENLDDCLNVINSHQNSR
jgi:hypothetical protein